MADLSGAEVEGLAIPIIENLASHQGTYDTLNLTDNSITVLGNIPLGQWDDAWNKLGNSEKSNAHVQPRDCRRYMLPITRSRPYPHPYLQM